MIGEFILAGYTATCLAAGYTMGRRDERSLWFIHAASGRGRIKNFWPGNQSVTFVGKLKDDIQTKEPHDPL